MDFDSILLAKKLSGGGGGSSSPIQLLDTITVSSNVRGVNADFAPYSSYDFIFVYIDFQLNSADWLYFVRNSTSPSGGAYTGPSRNAFKGIAGFTMTNGGLFTNEKWAVVNSQSYQINASNDYTTMESMFIYTYNSSNTIKAGSKLSIYGGKYADM